MAYNVKGEQRNTGKTHFNKGFTPWNKGKTGVYSEEYLRKIGEASKKRLLANHPGKNKSRSVQEKQKISETMIKNNQSLFRNNYGYPDRVYWMELTEKVFIRDNYTCQECGSKLARIKGPGQVQCHHIDYDTTNNELVNLITLCTSCHAKTGYDRLEWMNYFKTRIAQVIQN